METSPISQLITPFIFFSQDTQPAPQAMPLDRPALHKAYCWWRQLDGSARITLANTTWNLKPGDVALTEPGARLDLGYRCRGRLVAFALTGGPYDCGTRNHYRMDQSLKPQPSWGKLFGVDLVPKVTLSTKSAVDVIDFIYANYWRSPYLLLECQARLHLWVARYVQLLNQKAHWISSDDWCLRTERIVAADVRNASVAGIAKRLGVSRQYLSRTYSRNAGHTLASEINRQRIECAKGVLRHTKLSIKKIAHQVGYRSASAFGQAFRTVTGLTPLKWRQGSIETEA